MTLKETIKKAEGYSPTIYMDSVLKPTIYYGHLIRQGEVYHGTKEDAERYLDQDIAIAQQGCINLFPTFHEFTTARQDALTELVFNLGASKIRRKFPRFLNAINIGDWDSAYNELKYADGKSELSLWYRQVKARRADRILESLL